MLESGFTSVLSARNRTEFKEQLVGFTKRIGFETVAVTLVDRAQTLPYLLTNTSPQAGGLSTYAFITVPALGDFPPMARPRAPELVVVAGDELVIVLDEQVQVAPGRQVVCEQHHVRPGGIKWPAGCCSD